MKRNVLKAVLFILLVGCAGMFFYTRIQSKQSADAYREAESLAAQTEPTETELESVSASVESEPEPTKEPETEAVLVDVWQEVEITDDPYMEELTKKDLEILRETNEDVLGWISIPDTQLSYPLMRGEDNQYYLEHTWEKVASIAGSIFMEQYNNPDFSDFNTVIYGHRMRDGSMFGSLKYYNEQEYWEAHPYIYIYDDRGCHRYEIFAAYKASVKGATYQVGFANEEYMQKFLDTCVGYSEIETGVVPTILDKVITLSTCTGTGYDSRWVVQARLEGEIVQKPESET